MSSLRVPACALLVLFGCQTPIATDETGATDGADASTTDTAGPPTNSASDTGAPDPGTTQGPEPTTGEPTTLEPTTQGPADTTDTADATDTTDTTGTTGPVVDPPPTCPPDGVLHGDLVIDDSTDLEGLGCIIELLGDVKIEHTQSLVSFPQLANLKRVAGDVKITDNAALVDLHGLAGLEQLKKPGGGQIRLDANPSLVDITGLAAVVQVGSVFISDCDALTDLTGLHGAIVGLSDPTWSLGLTGNASLTSLAPLAALDDFAGNLYLNAMPGLTDLGPLAEFLAPEVDGITIAGNPKLADLQGLEAITSVGTLDIRDNPALLDLTGLDGLQTIVWDFMLFGNSKLASLDGLQALTVANWLRLEANPKLTDLTALAGLTSVDYLQVGVCGEQGNDALVDLDGLDGLTHLGTLAINENGALQDITALPHDIGLSFVEGFNNPKLPNAVLKTYLEETNLGDEWLCNNGGAPAMCECIFIEQP